MKKWAFIIDVEKCEDCNNCFLACKDEHVDNDWPGVTLSQPRHGHRWMNIHRQERGQYPLIDVAYLPVPCMHCDEAPCVKASKDGAVYKRDDGIVLIDPEKSKGQKEIMKACSYEAIWWNEEKDVPQKCTLCAHLLDEGWSQPRCVQACPTGALSIVHEDESEIKQIVSSQNLEFLHPQYRTSPRIYYKNLFRFTRCFVAGSVAYKKNGAVDCADGAEVILYKNAEKITETLTDNFGDFKFDSLEENSGQYTLEIKFNGDEKTLEVELEKGVNVGMIMFD